MESVLWLGDQGCHDPIVVGAKAASLSRLSARYRVPVGFCLTAGAHARWAPASASGPASGLMAQVAEAYGRLAKGAGATDPAVAVRSSAIGEDGAGASFAGQHDTYLNVSGAADVAGAVVRCWHSLHAEHARTYRASQGLDGEALQMPVLVQRLIPADRAMVAFSANPVTGDRTEVVINANWGLGESIVSGAVVPDTYVVRKLDMAIGARDVQYKEHMTVLEPGGTRMTQVPETLRTAPVLRDEDVAEVASLASSLEEAMGWPVDIECAYADGDLYLLQCRPITGLPQAG